MSFSKPHLQIDTSEDNVFNNQLDSPEDTRKTFQPPQSAMSILQTSEEKRVRGRSRQSFDRNDSQEKYKDSKSKKVLQTKTPKPRNFF